MQRTITKRAVVRTVPTGKNSCRRTIDLYVNGRKVQTQTQDIRNQNFR